MQDVFAARVLLVDDQPELLELVSGSLRQAGYKTVDTAAGCAEARACFAAHRPDVMILDINLPDGDGFSLFQELHRQADIRRCFFLPGTRTLTACLVWVLARTITSPSPF